LIFQTNFYYSHLEKQLLKVANLNWHLWEILAFHHYGNMLVNEKSGGGKAQLQKVMGANRMGW
jgi:hypothetical protein